MRGQAGMIRAGKPQGIISDQSAETGLDVLKREEQGMPHMQLARNVGRRHWKEPGRWRVAMDMKREATLGVWKGTWAPVLRARSLGRGKIEAGGKVQLSLVTSNDDIASSKDVGG